MPSRLPATRATVPTTMPASVTATMPAAMTAAARRPRLCRAGPRGQTDRLMRLLRRLLVLTAIAAGVLAFYNFYADNRDVEERARRVACAGESGPCAAALTRLERSPIRQ